jgi:hypothetical protein
MNPTDWLLTIAQVAMALTGFAGLLIAFRFRKQAWQRVEIHAVRFLLKSSVGAFVFALLPVPMIVGGMNQAWLWGICFAALPLWTLVMVSGAFRARYSGDLRPRYEFGYWGLTLSGLALGAVELVAAVDAFGLRPSGPLHGRTLLAARGSDLPAHHADHGDASGNRRGMT